MPGPMSEYEVEALTKAYHPFPPPCDEGFEALEKIRDWLEARGVQGTGGGVIAIAHAEDGYIFFAFSPGLQTEIAAKPAPYANMKSSHRAIQMLCEFVDKHLFAIFKKSTNPACAEKKILSVMRRKGKKIRNMTVGEYPEWMINERLSSHVSGGSGQRAFIAPCQTCLAAYTTAGFSPQKKDVG